MDYETFVGLVQSRARLGSREAAIAAIRATLETMGERLVGGELKDIASQLPREIAYYLTRATTAQKLSLQDFHARVGAREPCDPPQAVFHARVVMSVLELALSEGEVRDMRAQLPAEFNDLFEHREFLGKSPAAHAPGREQL